MYVCVCGERRVYTNTYISHLVVCHARTLALDVEPRLYIYIYTYVCVCVCGCIHIYIYAIMSNLVVCHARALALDVEPRLQLRPLRRDTGGAVVRVAL